MASQKLWPSVQILGRICNNRSELWNQSFRAYNYQQHNNGLLNISVQNSVLEDKYNFKHNLYKVGRGSYIKVVSRHLSSGTYHFCREFNDGENEHAHDVLCSIPAYNATTVNSKLFKTDHVSHLVNDSTAKNYFLAENDELIETFAKLSKDQNAPLNTEEFSNLCLSLSERMVTLNDNHILTLLTSLSHVSTCHPISASCFVTLKNSLDNACTKRVRHWDVSTVFLVADHWYALGISKKSFYFSKLLQIIGSSVDKLTPSQLVQFMFYANINRGFEAIKTKNLLYSIKRSIKDISVEELGIIAMGLFKTQTVLKDQKLNQEIILKTFDNIETISNHSLGSILKFLSKSLPGNADVQCFQFLDELNPHLEKFNNLVLLQVALFGNNLLVFHEGVMEKVAVRFDSSMSELRLKDIERFTYTLMLYKFLPLSCENIREKILEELRKPERLIEINHFPKCFVSCINYLVTMGIFPLDLISAALQPSMIQLLQASSADVMGRELSELNWSLKIEGPKYYRGYKLDPQLSDNLTKQFLGRIPNPSLHQVTHQERFMIDVQKRLSAILGSEQLVLGTIILPHFYNPDLVFCTDDDGNPVDIPPEYMTKQPEDIKMPIEYQGMMWNVVMLGGRNSYLRNSEELRGNFEMKIRQLTCIGYRVTVIPYSSYSNQSIKYKLGTIARHLKINSTLSLTGREEKALQLINSAKQDALCA